jgi:hypothetical protein
LQLGAGFFYQGLLDGIFSKQKIPIWVNYGGVLQRKLLVFYMAIWAIFGEIFLMQYYDHFCIRCQYYEL